MRTLLVLLLLLASHVTAQRNWRMVRVQGHARTTAMDPVRGRLVCLNLGSHGQGPATMLWEWDGRFWSHLSAGVAPIVAPSLAWDPVQSRILSLSEVVVAPGNTTQTWSWDGQSWFQHAPTINPPPFNGTAALATDFTRSRVVAFGAGWGGAIAGTWEWDGTNWAQRYPANAPSARAGFMMAWNAARGRVTLHGGTTGFNAMLGDTWEWDGNNWLLRATNGPARMNAGLGTAPNGNLVLFGGVDNSIGPALAETWTWDGTTWIRRFPAHSPRAQTAPHLALDAVRGVTTLLSTQSMDHGELWEWDGLDWLQRCRGFPIQSQGEALAADPQRGRVVAFGWDGATPLTWEWDGSEWRRFLVTGPSYRRDSVIAYAGNGQTLLFGGENPQLGITYADTWTWNGSSWTQRYPVTSPSARIGHAMAFDAARGEVVLFGGSRIPLGDTWTWNGSNWTLRSPATKPPPRSGHAMAYDPARSVVVMFGGTAVPDIHEWNGTDWQLAPTSGGPPGLRGAMLTTSPDGQGVVLHGGYTFAGLRYAQLQHWNGTSWTPLAITGPQQLGNGVLDPVHRHVVLGGDWLLDGPSHAEVTPFGSGCPGSAGRPKLGIAGAWPFLGNTITLEVTLVPATAIVVLVLGFSADQFGTAALPLELSNVGMPRCWLYSSAEASDWLVASNGVATRTLTVPNSVRLLGVELFGQAAAIDPPANVAGLTVSNGLKLRIGQ